MAINQWKSWKNNISELVKRLLFWSLFLFFFHILVKDGGFCMEQKTMPNQAELQEEVVLGDRDELLLFHLKAEEKEFVLGLSDVLECLKFAERKGIVPPIPGAWWLAMSEVYPELREIAKEILPELD